MEYLILEIAKLLRSSGIAVGMSEIEDCLHLMKAVGSKLDRYDFYRLVNTTMVKAAWGEDFILWLVELYYGPNLEPVDFRPQRPPSRASSFTGDATAASGGRDRPVDLLVEAVLRGQNGLIFAMIRGMSLFLEPDREDRKIALLDFQRQSGWLETAAILEQRRRDELIDEAAYQQAQGILKNWNILLEEEIEQQLLKNMSREYLLAEMKKFNPRIADFLDNDNSLETDMSREIQKLGRRLAIRKGRRRRVGKKGAVDLQKTLRFAIKTGGIPISLVKLERKPGKPDLWLLCDMSNSVSRFCYFMLMLVYITQKRYSHIRSFLFVDMLLEVTDYFEKRDWNEAIGGLRTLRGFNLTGYSHYGNVLRQFADTVLAELTPQTTVLILGDAKNNSNIRDGSEVLAEIKDKAAALHWLNPINPDRWSRDDCLMEKYRENCTQAVYCSNIEQLEKFLTVNLK